MNDPANRSIDDLYRPLPPNFTRVLELDAGEFSDPIVGRLVPQAMNAEPYEAISYVWGNPQKRRDIIIDGATFAVTENLHGALTAFRHRPVAENEADGAVGHPVRRLWADAVSINQEDLQERISQVELMSSIYASASRVLAWLGWEEGEEGRRHMQDAIRFIQTFMRDTEAGLNDARILLLHHDHLADRTEDLAHLSEDNRCLFEEQARKWGAVKAFFEIEYFHRAWIVQELGLAREALLITALKPTDNSQYDGYALEVDIIDWPLVGRFVKLLDYSGASLVTHLGLLSWVAHHILMVWETKEDGSPDCDFLTGMHWTRILRVTDPRDRAFSLLGHPMAVMDSELVIHPDYTRTRGVVYTRLAVNFIRKTKNLYIVSLVDHEDDPCLEQQAWDPQYEARMPSWVPDWHSINRTTPVDYPTAAAANEDDLIRFEGGVDCEDGTLLPQLIVRGWVVDKILAVSHRMETTDFPITHLARERTKQNPFWLDQVWEIIYPSERQDSGFVRTIGNALAVLDSLSLALSFGTRENEEPVSKAGLNQTREEHQQSFAAYVLEYHDLLQVALSEAGVVIGDEDNSYLPVRSKDDSLPREAQNELRRRAKGVTPGGFLECMTWPSMCRVVYRTALGLVGMGSRIAKPDDLVCRVRGSAVLMTLRNIENSEDAETSAATTDTQAAMSTSCIHIGPTVVPDRMKRDVIDGSILGEKAAIFRIL
ncbi:heterokaryon incompatibility protein-domain-containing protein [Ampelomyces quisqualis]|uniref:Heterokaryon incompatibility protein-domain-containing protein n=1 Tax=Ampelomyces quisqualis TaxID=50730 RepID=A0A6A5QK76_AMPQU|nr:heterokaryon incompatibility protein-domain-containing protein [Ampelomyces quisqualis]